MSGSIRMQLNHSQEEKDVMQRKCTSSTSLMWSLWAAACRRIAKHIQVGSITHFFTCVLYFWKVKTGGRLGIPDATAPPERLYLIIEQLFELTRRPSRAFKPGVFWALFHKIRSKKTQKISLKLSTSEAR